MSVVSVRPINERIAYALFERLQYLAAGYSPYTAVSEVIRPTRMGGYTPKHLQIVLTQDAPERNEELDCPGNPPAIAWDQRFNIRCHVMPSEKDPTPVDELVNTMAADVQQVVTDATDWHTFGDLALNAQWQTPENIDGDGGIDGINVPLVITYRVAENNPYQKR